MKNTILFLYLILNYTCLAQETVPSEDLSKALANSSYEPSYFGMIFGLFIVVGLVYLTAYIYQKLLKVNIVNNSINNKIEIISTTSLGQGKNLHVIKLNDNYMLISSTQNSINYLKDIAFKENIKDEQNCQNCK